MKNTYAWGDPLRDMLVKGSEFMGYESLECCYCTVLTINARVCEWARGYLVHIR